MYFTVVVIVHYFLSAYQSKSAPPPASYFVQERSVGRPGPGLDQGTTLDPDQEPT